MQRGRAVTLTITFDTDATDAQIDTMLWHAEVQITDPADEDGEHAPWETANTVSRVEVPDQRSHRDRLTARAEAAEAALERVRRALADEEANLADDGARLSHAVVRRLLAAIDGPPAVTIPEAAIEAVAQVWHEGTCAYVDAGCRNPGDVYRKLARAALEATAPLIAAAALRELVTAVRSGLDATEGAGIDLGDDYLHGMRSALDQAWQRAADLEAGVSDA